ncbi:MAG: hypothetical protein ACYDHX_06095 [Methanothrix sp.]
MSPPPRPSAPAQVRQQLYAKDKFAEILAQMEAGLPKDEAGKPRHLNTYGKNIQEHIYDAPLIELP